MIIKKEQVIIIKQNGKAKYKVTASKDFYLWEALDNAKNRTARSLHGYLTYNQLVSESTEMFIEHSNTPVDVHVNINDNGKITFTY